MPRNTDSGGGALTPQQTAQIAAANNTATASSTHEMFVAILILLGVTMVLVLIAGESPDAGKVILGIVGIMVLVQGIGHVNPLTAWLADHPLTPTQS